MSMQTVEYQGYGVDLGAFTSDDPKKQKLWDFLILNAAELNDFLEEHGQQESICLVSPCNTESFSLLAYIPAVIPVSDDGEPIKTYTKEEANAAFVDLIKKLLMVIVSGDDEAVNAWNVGMNEPLKQPTKEDVDKLMPDVKKFVVTYASYSWDKDWTDAV